MQSGDDLRARIAAAAFGLPHVSDRRMFGADVYMVQGRMFAFLETAVLGIKLPSEYRRDLLDNGVAQPYLSTQGRPFGDWLALPLRTPSEVERAVDLLEVAHGYAQERAARPSPRQSPRHSKTQEGA